MRRPAKKANKYASGIRQAAVVPPSIVGIAVCIFLKQLVTSHPPAPYDNTA